MTPFDPKKASVSLLLWLARRSAEDGYDTWWRDPSAGLTPRTIALMDKAYREATQNDSTSAEVARKGHAT